MTILCPSEPVPLPLFPRAEGYNPLDPSTGMTARRNPDLDPEAVEAALGQALAAHFLEENDRLGLTLRADRLRTVARSLLRGEGPEAEGSQGPLRQAAQEPPFREREHEPRDYLHLVPQEIRKGLGQYVTPVPIVRSILRSIGYLPEEPLLDRSFCDPACGSGVFVVEAIRTYLAVLRRRSILAEDWYPRVAAHFTALDVDPIACLYARFNLGMLLSPAILTWMNAHPRRLPPRLPVRHTDTLLALGQELKGEGAPQSPGGFLRNRFDFIAGNPPYKKLGRDAQAYRDAFQESIYGHANAYGLFLHAGLEMLPPAGRLGFIVPRSMLSGLYFQNLRKLIEERTDLTELTLFTERRKIFDEVLQGTMIVAFQKRPLEASAQAPSEIPAVRTSIVRKLKDLERGAPFVMAPRTQIVRRLNGTTVWFVSDKEKTYSVLERIIGSFPLLGGSAVACPARTGPIVWNRVKPSLRWQKSHGNLPLVWATDVSRFQFNFGTSSSLRAPYLRDMPGTRELATSGASLLVQRVTADEQARRIVASLADLSAARYYVENHLNVIQPQTDLGRIDLRYVLGILSSDVIEFFFRSMNGNTQVSATELNLLPVPRGRFEKKIVELVARREETAEPSSQKEVESEINERVASAYALTRADLAYIRNALDERAARTH